MKSIIRDWKDSDPHDYSSTQNMALGKEEEKADVSGVHSGYRKRRAQERIGRLLAESKGSREFPNCLAWEK